MLQCTFLFLSMQIGHRWTRMYLIEKHMCGTFKNNNSYSPPPPFAFCPRPVPVILRSFIKSYVWPWCWRRATPIVKLFKWGHHVSFVYCLEWRHGNKVGVLMISISHPRATTATSFSLLLHVDPLEERSWALWEAINESVAWRVVMRDILQPFIRARRHLTGGQPTGCVII